MGVQFNAETDMTKLIIAFRNFANAPKNLKTQTVDSTSFDDAILTAYRTR